MSLFPRFATGEFSPLFRLLDDYANHVSPAAFNQAGGERLNLRSFTPRFDVKELKDAYELHGELPGIEQKDINIEFSDHNTITISGRTERHYEEGERPSGLIEGREQGKITGEAHEENHYHKPTVEEEGEGSTTTNNNNATSTEVTKTDGDGKKDVAQKPAQPQHKYWVSERSIGEFQRSFSFPQRVDQDNVKASLKNGILSIVVPKAKAPVSRKINIE